VGRSGKIGIFKESIWLEERYGDKGNVARFVFNIMRPEQWEYKKLVTDLYREEIVGILKIKGSTTTIGTGAKVLHSCTKYSVL